MEITKEEILHRTHYGLNIYAHILRKYYPGETVVKLIGKMCEPIKNPFSNHKPTLQLSNKNWVFNFCDTDDPKFKGDPLDFAAHHYNANGSKLLELINSEMNLNIDAQNGFYKKSKTENMQNKTISSLEPESPRFSYFKAPVYNTQPHAEVCLTEVYKMIKSGVFKEQTSTLQAITNGKQAREYKAQHFDYVTFSGVFSARSNDALQTHSGLMCIDFDHLPNIYEVKEALINDALLETELLFTSPSGDGLKWIISTDLTEVTHEEYFQAVSNYLSHTYNLEIDKSGKDVSRACFLPYDNNIFINDKYLRNE